MSKKILHPFETRGTPAQKPLVLAMSHDMETRPILERNLPENFELVLVHEEKEVFKVASARKVDFIVLDLMDASESSMKFCTKVRHHESTNGIPVVVLAKFYDFETKIHLIGQADHVLEKPFMPRELVARMRSRLMRVLERRQAKGTRQIISIENLALNLETYECTVSGELMTMSVLEFNLLRFFMENIGKVLSREKILRGVWRDGDVGDRTIDTHMTSLRKKIRGSRLKFITIYGAGYALKYAS